jgi:hypothetical protein
MYYVYVHTNLTWTGTELNPVLCGARPTNNSLSHGMTLKTDKNKAQYDLCDDLSHLQVELFYPEDEVCVLQQYYPLDNMSQSRILQQEQ